MATAYSGSLLVVDDDKHIRVAMADYLRSLGYRTETAGDYSEAIRRMEEFLFDVVVCDVNLPDRDGFELLQWGKENSSDTSIILLTGFGTIESAVEAMRMGAFDYLTKPVIDEELNLSIERAIGQQQLLKENTRLKAQLDEKHGLSSIIGKDYKMLRMFELIESVAETPTTVLILGESGTGKTITARSLHQLSDRSNKPFVEVACGALPDSLLESELFGHVTGSFTGATHNKIGKFLQASGGTLFLDEISTASPQLQIKLLRVLQDREFEPVGGNETHKVDVRLVLATNEDLEQAVERGEFREDLYYRINVITLTQPSLREKIGDIPLLAEHYIAQFNEQTGRSVQGIDEQAMLALQQYHWPGNVRELLNVLERAVVLSQSDLITSGDLPEKMFVQQKQSTGVNVQLGNDSLKTALTQPERQLIIQALEANSWNRQNTAKGLGINRTTLYKKMKRYNIDFESVYRYV